MSPLPVIIVSLWVLAGCAQLPAFSQNKKASDEASASEALDSKISAYKSSPLSALRPKKAVPAKVVRVINGDTIEVEVEGEKLTVGYLGVDAPEVDHPVHGTEPYGEKAMVLNRQLIEGESVLLENDIIRTDDDGRQLRYVYLEDLMINGVLLYEGLAQVVSYPQALKYADLLYKLQNEAAAERKGAWRDAWRSAVPRR